MCGEWENVALRGERVLVLSAGKRIAQGVKELQMPTAELSASGRKSVISASAHSLWLVAGHPFVIRWMQN